MKGYIDSKKLSALKQGKRIIHNLAVNKELKVIGFKVVPSAPTAEQIEKINRFTRREFKSDELYVGQLRLSNNCIDRDNERFSEEVLQRFVATTLRKTMLFDHERRVKDSAIGKFFDVELEKMPIQQAIAEIGEELILPDGITDVWFHSPWFYIPIAGIDPKDIVKIDAGIYDFGSIGFRAESLVPVIDDKGDVMFWEYRGSGRNTEMTEGSLVYLGAQYGMSIKSTEDIPGSTGDANTQSNEVDPPVKPEDDITKKGGNKQMEKFLKILQRLFPGKSFTEDGLSDELKAALDAHAKSASDEAVATAVKPLNEKIAELSPLAADGKAYRDGLITQYVTLKAKLGEVAETPEAQDKVKAVAAAYPIDFLKSEVAALEKRVDEKFPAEPQTKGDERRDKSGDGGAVDWKKKNPVVPDDDEEEGK
jgi:hypothetical protein